MTKPVVICNLAAQPTRCYFWPQRCIRAVELKELPFRSLRRSPVPFRHVCQPIKSAIGAVATPRRRSRFVMTVMEELVDVVDQENAVIGSALRHRIRGSEQRRTSHRAPF